jgi:hypothetical protein
MTTAVAFRRTAKFIDTKFESAKQNETLCSFCEYLQMMTLMTLPVAVPFLIIFLETNYR